MKEFMPDVERLRELLVGKSIISAEIKDESPEAWHGGPTGFVTLSDNTVLKLWGNEGGCSCSAGDYPITSLNGCENVITNVEVVDHPAGDDISCRICDKGWCEHYGAPENQGYYKIFVFALEDRVNLASFERSDGNGYYGTGWWLEVAG